MISRVLYFLFGLQTIAGYTPKICVNCKFYIKSDLSSYPEYGVCMKYPKDVQQNANYLVTGVKEKPEYMYCSTARGNAKMCGTKGNDYVRVRAKKPKKPKGTINTKSESL